MPTDAAVEITLCGYQSVLASEDRLYAGLHELTRRAANASAARVAAPARYLSACRRDDEPRAIGVRRC
jgi:hypothetical protein